MQLLVEATNGNIITSNWTESSDGDVQNATHFGADIWIVALDNWGSFVNSKTSEQKNINQNFANTLSSYPNPFSNSTIVSFTLSQSQKAMPAGRQVSIRIFDIAGRLMKILANTETQAGTHQITWNVKDEKGNAVASGMYFLRTQTGNYTETRKLSVVK